MFKLISPLSKVVVLTLSAGLTWSTVGTVAQGFHGNASPVQHIVQLPPVLVIGHRDAAMVTNQPDSDVPESAAQAKLTTINQPGKDTAI
jgi:hypothetical protein